MIAKTQYLFLENNKKSFLPLGVFLMTNKLNLPLITVNAALITVVDDERQCLIEYNKYHFQNYFHFFGNNKKFCLLLGIWNELFHRNNFDIWYVACFDKVLKKMCQNAAITWSQRMNVWESCTFVLRLIMDKYGVFLGISTATMSSVI